MSQDNIILWGQVGKHKWQTLSDKSSEEAIVRTVPPGVAYTPPPSALGLRCWKTDPTNAQRFEMPWTSDPQKVLSLSALGESLRNQSPEDGDPRLASLTSAVESLLRLADRVHDEKHGLGLISPANVLVVPGKEGAEILLADWGFVWQRGPVKPDWLKPHDLTELWDAPPEVQQHVTGGQLSPEERKKSDIRTLGRLLACVLTGVPQKELKDSPPEFSQHHQKDNAEVLGEIWRTLAAASRGEIPSAGKLAEQLERTPLRGHFFANPPLPEVNSLKFDTGPATGGTQVVITGRNFLCVKEVAFGPNLAVKFTADSPTQITASAPPHAAGTVDVLVTTLSGTSASVQFTYLDAAVDSKGRTPIPIPALIGIGGLVLLLLIALGVWNWWPTGSTDTSKAENGSKTKTERSLAGQYRQAKEQDKAALLAKMWHKGAKPEDAAGREKLRGEFLADWKNRLGRVQNNLYSDHPQKFEYRGELSSLHDDLKLLQNHPADDQTLDQQEKRCLAFAALLLGQF